MTNAYQALVDYNKAPSYLRWKKLAKIGKNLGVEWKINDDLQNLIYIPSCSSTDSIPGRGKGDLPCKKLGDADHSA